MTVLPNNRTLPVDRLRDLLGQKKQIREAAAGRISEGLTQAIVRTIMRLARNERAIKFGLVAMGFVGCFVLALLF